ncbi:hypothetical protein OG320_28105 [Microbispora sp. NBC_01189]|uniref:hypothetical protein n=1 Tax=Microbispora sp. NBC_01189 TaxID=2903583 RepID=UPI002E15BCF6|nr:hypothetical protein OG320_28105 [Microbispora sp. NBC_01189]
MNRHEQDDPVAGAAGAGRGDTPSPRRRAKTAGRVGAALLGALTAGCLLTTAACASPASGEGSGPMAPSGASGASGASDTTPRGAPANAAGDTPANTLGGAPGNIPGDQVKLARTADRIDAVLRRDFPRHYAGVALAPSGHRLIVYRRPSAGLDAALRGRFPGAPVQLRDAPHAARELDALAARVRRDIGYWRRRGVSVTSVAARPDGTAVEVGVTGVARASAVLRRRYGSAPLAIVEAGPTLIPAR